MDVFSMESMAERAGLPVAPKRVVVPEDTLAALLAAEAEVQAARFIEWVCREAQEHDESAFKSRILAMAAEELGVKL